MRAPACVCDQSCMLEFPSFHSTLLLLPFSSVGAVATLFPIFLRFLLIRVGALVGLGERVRERVVTVGVCSTWLGGWGNNTTTKGAEDSALTDRQFLRREWVYWLAGARQSERKKFYVFFVRACVCLCACVFWGQGEESSIGAWLLRFISAPPQRERERERTRE